MPPGKPSGAGVYAIYYSGHFAPYEPVAVHNRGGQFDCPIYVGKGVPRGSRKGGAIVSTGASRALSDRLKLHSDSIDQAENLRLEDFYCRLLVVDDIWFPLGETFLIEKFQPLWNKVVTGFGIKTPGMRRSAQQASVWDTLHPGRKFVGVLGLAPNPKSYAGIAADLEQYFTLPAEEKAKLAASDDEEFEE